MGNKMSNIKYAIRHQSFGYNDEWYNLDWATQGSIKAVYDDKATAEQAYKALIVKALYQDDFYNFSIANGEGSEEQYAKIETFILEKTGQEFDPEDMPELNDEDAFEFAKLSGILHYQLIEVDTSIPTYVLFNPESNQYLYAAAPDEEIILTGQDEDLLFNSADYLDDYWKEQTVERFFDEFKFTFQGSLEELSETPLILQQFINENTVWLSYQNQTLKINHHKSYASFDRIKALNALLKIPVFEIRKISLEELAKISN